MDVEERRRKLFELKKDLKRRAALNKLQYRRKTLQDKRLEKSSLSKSQSSFDRSYRRHTVLLMNNRALAKSLEKFKIENRLLLNKIQKYEAQHFQHQLKIRIFTNLLREKLSDLANVVDDVDRTWNPVFDEFDDDCSSNSFLPMAKDKPWRVQNLACEEQGGPDCDSCRNEEELSSHLIPVEQTPPEYVKTPPCNLSAVMETSHQFGIAANLSDEESPALVDGPKTGEEGSRIKDRRVTFVVTESQQTMELPTPIRAWRRRLRRTTLTRNIELCNTSLEMEKENDVPQVLTTGTPCQAAETPPLSSTRNDEFVLGRKELNSVVNNTPGGKVDDKKCTLDNLVSSNDPETTSWQESTKTLFKSPDIQAEACPRPLADSQPRRVTFHSSTSVSSKAVPDSSTPELESDDGSFRRATKSVPTMTAEPAQVDMHRHAPNGRLEEEENNHDDEENLCRPRRQLRKNPPKYKEPPLNRKMRRP